MPETVIIHHPFGPADVQSIDDGATMAATIVNDGTELTIAEMAAAGTLNLTLSDKLTKLAKLKIRVSCGGTGRTLTFGTKITGLAQALTASKSYVMSFYFDGTNFVHEGTNLLN